MFNKWNFPHLIKDIHRPHSCLVLNCEKLGACPESGARRTSPLTTAFQHHAGSPSRCSEPSKGDKGIQIGKEETKLSLFTDGKMIQKIDTEAPGADMQCWRR